MNPRVTLDTYPILPRNVLPLGTLGPNLAGVLYYSKDNINERLYSDKLGDVISILDFIPPEFHAGIVAGTNTTDLAPYFNAAVIGLNTGTTYTGGTIVIPAGYYKLNSPWLITTTNANGVASLVIQGANQHDTVLDFGGMTATGADAIQLNAIVGVSLRDFKVLGCATGANISQNNCSFISYDHLRVQQAFTSGIKIDNSFMTSLSNVLAQGNTGDGFNIGSIGYNTSIRVETCYGFLNSLAGYRLNNTAYSSFIGCGSDQNAFGYIVKNVRGVSFLSCGTESNYQQGFAISVDAASANVAGVYQKGIDGLLLQGCFAYLNYTRNINEAGAANFAAIQTDESYPLKIIMIGNTDTGFQTNVSRSVYFSGASFITEIQNGFSGTEVSSDNRQVFQRLQNGVMSLSNLGITYANDAAAAAAGVQINGIYYNGTALVPRRV